MKTETQHILDEASKRRHSKVPTSQTPPSATSSPPTSSRISRWRKYVFLYLPIVVSGILIFGSETISRAIGFSRFDGGNTLPIILTSAVPTYLLGSTVYPSNRPEPTPEQSIRFTRKNDWYRILVLLTYGRLFGTPFNPIFFAADILCSYGADSLIGERPLGTPQRRSEFFVALQWVAGSWVLHQVIPFSTPVIGILLGALDRTLWRMMYIAFVDDVVGVLARPDLRSARGKTTLFLVLTFIIVAINFLARYTIKRLAAVHEQQNEGVPA